MQGVSFLWDEISFEDLMEYGADNVFPCFCRKYCTVQRRLV